MNPPSRPHRILFVCMGNICRSPAAEIVFRKLVDSSSRSEEFEIDSAGTIGSHQGEPPDSRMSAALKRRGYTISGRARKIQPADLLEFDRIITMDDANFADVKRLDPSGSTHSKIRPLVSYCTTHDASCVPDPYYGGAQGFEHVIDLLEDGCQEILREFSR